MTTTLYLIRHGETEWNLNGRWQGHADVPLNDKGLRQARLLAERLLNEGVQFDAIYSSDLTRAYQTAWEVGALLKTAVQLLPALRELDMGNWSGLTRDEIRAQYPKHYGRLEQGEDVPRGVSGETLNGMNKRVVEVIEAMAMRHPDETLAMVSHGGPIRAILQYLIKKNVKAEMPKRHIGNTSITILRYRFYRWQIDSINDTSHLEGPQLEPELLSAPPDDAEQPASKQTEPTP